MCTSSTGTLLAIQCQSLEMVHRAEMDAAKQGLQDFGHLRRDSLKVADQGTAVVFLDVGYFVTSFRIAGYADQTDENYFCI